jgi:hypothetical protein
MCPLPTATAPQGTLVIHETHEFGQNYNVLSSTYSFDDCVLLRSDDSALLRKPAVVFEPRKVAAGSHAIRFVIKFRSGFSADMHDYTWDMGGTVPIDVPESATSSVTLRMYEDEQADPRDRMRVEITQGTEGDSPPE